MGSPFLPVVVWKGQIIKILEFIQDELIKKKSGNEKFTGKKKTNIFKYK